MKKFYFFFAFLIYSVSLFAQFLVEEGFSSGAVAPSGWTFSGSIATYSTVGFYGKSSPSLKFQASGDQVTTKTWSNGDQLTFLLIGQTTANSSDYMQVEVYDGSSWTTIANVQPHTTSKIVTLTISTSVTKARFTYSKGATNASFDDFTVRQAGSCSGSSFKLTFINADACGALCEGRDEFFTFTTGSNTLNISDIEFNYPDANSFSSSWCGTGTTPCDNYLVTNSGEVTSLNTLAGCTVLLSPSGGIPPNSNVIIFNGNPQNTQTNFSNLCSTGVQYYAIFANNTSDCTGRFANYTSSSPDPYRSFFIRDRSTGCTDTNYYYANSSALNHGDGSSVSYIKGSGPSYVQTNCTFVVLPITLLSFNAVLRKNDVQVLWSTASEINNDYFTVEKSTDARSFEAIGVVKGAGNSTVEKDYQFIDDASPLSFEMNAEPLLYYRLKQTDYDGKYSYSRIVAIDLRKDQTTGLKIFPNPTADWVYISLPNESLYHKSHRTFNLHIFTVDGREALPPQGIVFADNSFQPFNVSALSKGAYILQLDGDNTIQRASLIKE